MDLPQAPQFKFSVGSKTPPLPGYTGIAPGASMTVTPPPATKAGGQAVGTAMPLDAAGQIALQQAAAARQAYLSSVNQNRELTNQNYQEQSHDLRAQHPLDQASVNDSYGSSGLGFSSGYGIANGQLADVYNKDTDRLALARADALAQDKLNRENYLNSYRVDLAGIRQAAADRLSGNAGHLHLGKPTSSGLTLAQILQGIGG